jgi:hypothetical protein
LRDARHDLRGQCPPSWKKSAVAEMRSMPRTACQTRSRRRSLGVAGATYSVPAADEEATGAGSFFLSTFPFGVSGNAVISTKCCGTM